MLVITSFIDPFIYIKIIRYNPEVSFRLHVCSFNRDIADSNVVGWIVIYHHSKLHLPDHGDTVFSIIIERIILLLL